MGNRDGINFLIRQLWLAFKTASDHQEDLDKLSDEDMKLWEEITNHPAIQNRLDSSNKIIP